MLVTNVQGENQADLGGNHFPELIQFLYSGPNRKVVYLLSAASCFLIFGPFFWPPPLPVLGHFRVRGVCVCLKSHARSMSILRFPLCQLKAAFLHSLAQTRQHEMNIAVG